MEFTFSPFIAQLAQAGIRCHQDADSNWELVWEAFSGRKASAKTIEQAITRGFRFCSITGCKRVFNHPDVSYRSGCQPVGPRTRRQWQGWAANQDEAVNGIHSGAASN